MDKKQKIMSFAELTNTRKAISDKGNRVSAPCQNMTFVIDDPRETEGYEERMRLAGRVQDVINAYESATTAREKYKAESELCRLVDRISGGRGIAPGVQNGDRKYIARVIRDGEYRIPQLHVVEGISPSQLSRMEFDLMFPDKSGSMPNPRTPEQSLELRDLFSRHYAGVLGVEPKTMRKYVGVVSNVLGERARGVKKE